MSYCNRSAKTALCGFFPCVSHSVCCCQQNCSVALWQCRTATCIVVCSQLLWYVLGTAQLFHEQRALYQHRLASLDCWRYAGMTSPTEDEDDSEENPIREEENFTFQRMFRLSFPFLPPAVVLCGVFAVLVQRRDVRRQHALRHRDANICTEKEQEGEVQLLWGKHFNNSCAAKMNFSVHWII